MQGSIYPRKAITIINIKIIKPIPHTSKWESNSKHKKITLKICMYNIKNIKDVLPRPKPSPKKKTQKLPKKNSQKKKTKLSKKHPPQKKNSLPKPKLPQKIKKQSSRPPLKPHPKKKKRRN